MFNAPPDYFKYGEIPLQMPQPFYPGYFILNPIYAVPVETYSMERNVTQTISVVEPVPTSVPVENTPAASPKKLEPQSPELREIQSDSSTEQSTEPTAKKKEAPKSKIGMLRPLDAHAHLEQSEREAYYQCLSDALGPACGIQESVGTYKAYMTKQTQAYYQRLLGDRTPVTPSTPGLTSARPLMQRTASACNVSPVPGSSIKGSSSSAAHLMACRQSESQTPEFSSWLLYAGRSHPTSLSSSRAHTPSLASDCGTDITTTGWTVENSFEDYPTQPCLDIGDILESPVLKPRHPSNESLPKTPQVLMTVDIRIQPAKDKRISDLIEERRFRSLDHDDNHSSLLPSTPKIPIRDSKSFSQSIPSLPRSNISDALTFEDVNIPDLLPEGYDGSGARRMRPRLTRTKSIPKGSGI